MNALQQKTNQTNHFTSLSGKEIILHETDMIVSKTDTKGIIRYANDTFCRISGFPERKLVGSPHSIVRHPSMPRTIFKYLWATVKEGKETFAYVINRTAKNDYYWVFAHVTPSYSADRTIFGFHSNRRKINRSALDYIEPLYTSLLEIENQRDRHNAADAGLDYLQTYLKEREIEYEEFVLSLCTF